MDHPYFRQTLLLHLVEVGQNDKLVAVLFDPALVETIWSKDSLLEWQRHISSLRHAVSLTGLVQEWLKTHVPAGAATAHDAVVTGKLGRLFHEIGAFDQAMVLTTAALDIWRANHIGDSPDVVESLLVMGRIQSLRDELDRATETYEKALAIAQRVYDSESQEMADVFQQLCVFYTQVTRDYTKAWDANERCLAICSRGAHPRLMAMANCINDRAVILMAQGQAADYLGIFREALSLFERAQRGGHPEMVATLGNIGGELRKQGKVEEAVAMFRRAVRLADEILLPQQEYSRSARAGLAGALFAMGKYDEALALMRNHVAEMERFPGPDHEQTADARLELCQALVHALQLSDHAMLRDYAEEMRREARRAQHARPAAVFNLIRLAESLRQGGAPDPADVLLSAARRGARGNADRPHSDQGEAVAARCFADALDAVISTKLFIELALKMISLWEDAEEKLKSEADWLPKTRRRIVGLIAWSGRSRLLLDGEVTTVREAFDLITRIGAESPDTLDHLASLTVSLHGRHHDEISESLCERLLAISERVLGLQHVQTLTYLENLGHIQVHRGKLEEAEKLYRKAFRTRIDTGGSEHKNSIIVIVSLAECLLMEGKNEEARKLIREFVAELPPDISFSSARKMLARRLSASGIELKNEFGAFAEAKACHELSLEIDPDSAGTHNNMAVLLWVCLDDAEAAASHFRTALSLEPRDGNAHSNYAHLLAHTMNDPTQAEGHFEKATSLDPNNGGILANYASMLLLQGDIEKAWSVAKRSLRLCLLDQDRIMARPLFCAIAILLLRGHDAGVPLGQLKNLFAHGIDHVSWVVTALLATLGQQLPEDSSRLMRAIADAISGKEGLAALGSNARWQAVEPVVFTAPWPEL